MKSALGTLSVLVTLSGALGAQCLDWRGFPLTPPELTGDVLAATTFDDGTGTALYLGGAIDRTPGQPWLGLKGVQRWNGSAYSNVGSGISRTVRALSAFDDGSGAKLYAGCDFEPFKSSVRRWDGSTWQSVGSSSVGHVRALCVYDDGSGGALYAAGQFTYIDGVAAASIAKWDGTSWSALGAGLLYPSGSPVAHALAVYDDGSGAQLYVGGEFDSAGAIGAGVSRNFARWNGTTWSAVASGIGGTVLALATHDDGFGTKLFLGGTFVVPAHPTNGGIAKWNGTTISTVGIGGVGGAQVTALASRDDGTGLALHAGTKNVGGRADTIRWNGSTWSATGGSTNSSGCGSPTGLYFAAFASFDEGAGPRLFAGGALRAIDGVQGSVARWNGSAWTYVGTPRTGLNATVRALHVHDDGAGSALYAGGSFCTADDAFAQGVARWDGERWTRLADALRGFTITSMATHPVNGVPRLFIGTLQSRLAYWDGASWIYMGLSYYEADDVFALASYDAGAGAELYAGGRFAFVGGVGVQNVARWDGANWNSLAGGVVGVVNALVVHDDGSGPALYVGGTFTIAGTTSANRIARWDGTTWSAVGAGFDDMVLALAVVDVGGGPVLVAGGAFQNSGTTPTARVAQWDGTSWSALGTGLNQAIYSLAAHDDGGGQALYAGGEFTSAGAVPASRIAKWNGTSWAGLGNGIDGAVRALASFQDGSGGGADLYTGGTFATAGAKSSSNVAAWRGCEGEITRYCLGDGGTSACPCGNVGLSGRGCDNSFLTGGARLNGTGTASPDTIQLYASGELPNAATLVFQGDVVLTAPIAFGDGLRCAGGSLKRLYTTNAVNGSLTVPPIGQPSVSARSAALGDTLTPGEVRAYQAWYRDSNPAFCSAPSGNVWNLSNAVRIVW